MRSEFSLARFSTAAMVSLCVVTSYSRVLPATEPRPAKGKSDLSGPVKRLVNDLGSNRRAIRESARRRLLALGPAILEHLPAPNTVKNVATRVAIRRLIRTLERTTATRSARASQVTISGRPTLELCRRIRSRHGGIELITGGGIRGSQDISDATRAGADAVLVASALHDGSLLPD